MERMTRRRVLGSGLAALALVATPAAALARPKTRTAYGLDPEWGAGDPGCPAVESLKPRSCHACSACHGHAANKLWRTASDVRRAHPGCKCDVVPVLLPEGTFLALFGPDAQPERSEVDRRQTRVQAILRGAR